MIFNLDLNTLATMGVGGLVAWGLRGIRNINSKLNTMNGDLRVIKTWQIEHEKKDNDRHTDTKHRIERLEEAE